MQSETFDLIEQTFREQGAASAIDRLVTEIERDKDHHRLFDALCLRAKHGLGLPLTAPHLLRRCARRVEGRIRESVCRRGASRR